MFSFKKTLICSSIILFLILEIKLRYLSGIFKNKDKSLKHSTLKRGMPSNSTVLKDADHIEAIKTYITDNYEIKMINSESCEDCILSLMVNVRKNKNVHVKNDVKTAAIPKNLRLLKHNLILLITTIKCKMRFTINNIIQTSSVCYRTIFNSIIKCRKATIYLLKLFGYYFLLGKSIIADLLLPKNFVMIFQLMIGLIPISWNMFLSVYFNTVFTVIGKNIMLFFAYFNINFEFITKLKNRIIQEYENLDMLEIFALALFCTLQFGFSYILFNLIMLTFIMIIKFATATFLFFRMSCYRIYCALRKHFSLLFWKETLNMIKSILDNVPYFFGSIYNKTCCHIKLLFYKPKAELKTSQKIMNWFKNNLKMFFRKKTRFEKFLDFTEHFVKNAHFVCFCVFLFFLICILIWRSSKKSQNKKKRKKDRIKRRLVNEMSLEELEFCIKFMTDCKRKTIKNLNKTDAKNFIINEKPFSDKK
ncbi:hypothetical protein NUSPORA_01853 [Nucleospora cyclopteri]